MSARKLMEQAIAQYGSETRLADAIGYTQSSVHMAKRRGWATWEMAVLIERATDIPASKLCPTGDPLKSRMQRSKRNGHHKR